MSHTLSQVVFSAVHEAALKIVTTPEFLKSMKRGDFTKLYDLITDIAKDNNIEPRQIDATNSFTPEAQAEILRQAFGADGQKQLDQISQGYRQQMPQQLPQSGIAGQRFGQPETAPDLNNTPVAAGFPIVKNELGDWVLNITDPEVKVNALMLMVQHLQANGITDGYRLGDVYYFYVDDHTNPNETVKFYNRSIEKRYDTISKLAGFCEWYAKAEKTVKERQSQFGA